MDADRFIRGLQWRLVKWPRAVRTRVLRRLYMDLGGGPEDSVLLVGSGRSGTTWLAELFAEQLRARILFEPFNGPQVPEYASFNYFQYMRPEDAYEDLKVFMSKVLAGRIRNPWIDRKVNRLTCSARVVKSIRANLMLRWIHNQFPDVPKLMIIRHPCAVVASRIQQQWATDGDLQPMLSQQTLVDDHLPGLMEIIDRATTPEEKHAIVWSIHNLVPLREFEPGELPIVFYEDLVQAPLAEAERVSQSLDVPLRREPRAAARRPSSSSSRYSAIRQGGNVLSAWTTRLSVDQIDRILNVVDEFGLSHLYGESTTPLCGPDSPELFVPWPPPQAVTSSVGDPGGPDA